MSGGWTDTPLTELGREQARLIGLRLKRDTEAANTIVFSSDLLRAKQTADIVAEHLGMEVLVEPGLREINTGVAAGKTKQWARENRNLRVGTGFDLDYLEFDGGETGRQFYARVAATMEHIWAGTDKDLILVTHGGTLSYIVAWWMGLTPDMMATAHFWASPASVTVLQMNAFGQHALRLLNGTSHLAPGTRPG